MELSFQMIYSSLGCPPDVTHELILRLDKCNGSIIVSLILSFISCILVCNGKERDCPSFIELVASIKWNLLQIFKYKILCLLVPNNTIPRP